METAKDVRDAQSRYAIDAMHETQYYGEVANYADQLGNPLQREDSVEALKTRIGSGMLVALSVLSLAGAWYGGLSLRGQRVGILVSGGNIDLARYGELLRGAF